MEGRVDMSRLLRLASRMGGDMLQELLGDLQAAVGKAAIETMAAARIASPTFTGELSGGIFTKGPRIRAIPSGIRIEDQVFATPAHALVVEEGRAAGATFPPLGPIRRWVQLRAGRGDLDISWTGKTGEAAIDRAAYVIAVAIHRKGLDPKKFMAAAAAKGEILLRAGVEEVARTWTARLEGAF